MEGSGPPLSQELVYARDTLGDVQWTLVRLHIASGAVPHADEKIKDIMSWLKQLSDELEYLARRFQDRGL